jgi:hypothetical protein
VTQNLDQLSDRDLAPLSDWVVIARLIRPTTDIPRPTPTAQEWRDATWLLLDAGLTPNGIARLLHRSGDAVTGVARWWMLADWKRWQVLPPVMRLAEARRGLSRRGVIRQTAVLCGLSEGLVALAFTLDDQRIADPAAFRVERRAAARMRPGDELRSQLASWLTPVAEALMP